MIGDNLSKVGCNVGCISAVDSQGRTIWIVDAHRGTIRGPRTPVSASMAQAASRDFLHSVIGPQPLASRKRWLT